MDNRQGTRGGSAWGLSWRVWAALGVLVLAVVLVFAFDLHTLLNFDTLALNFEALEQMVEANRAQAALVAALVYTVAVAVSVPAGWMLAVSMGLLFGWLLGGLLAVASATLGATILFVLVRHLFADAFRRRAGDWLKRFADGFREDAAHYMLSLRLAPVIPFFVLNALPAVLGVRLVTFAWTTFVGIIPGTMAYALAGDGVRHVVIERARACAENSAPCGEPVSPLDFVNPQLFIAFSLLGLLAVVPVVIRRLRAHKDARNHS